MLASLGLLLLLTPTPQRSILLVRKTPTPIVRYVTVVVTATPTMTRTPTAVPPTRTPQVPCRVRIPHEAPEPSVCYICFDGTTQVACPSGVLTMQDCY